jgi:hypothetical protein
MRGSELRYEIVRSVGQLDGGWCWRFIGGMMAGLVVTGGWWRMVRQEVRLYRGGGTVVRKAWRHCGTVAGQLGREAIVRTQGRVVAGSLTHTDHLLLPVGVGLLVLPVVGRGNVDLNVNGVRQEP